LDEVLAGSSERGASWSLQRRKADGPASRSSTRPCERLVMDLTCCGDCPPPEAAGDGSLASRLAIVRERAL
jgi:hypothetical protein